MANGAITNIGYLASQLMSTPVRAYVVLVLVLVLLDQGPEWGLTECIRGMAHIL